jgi:hypothetical protein
MKKFSVALLALAAALVISPMAMADPIPTGSALGITGGNDKWTSGGTITFTNLNALVTDDQGAFTNIPFSNPALVTQSSLTISTFVGEIFTTTYGGKTATFTINNMWPTLNSGVNLNISGTGILTLTGYDPTPGNFNFDSTDSGGNYGTNSSTWGIDVSANPTPEPSTLVMFGTGLLGLAGMLRRKFMQSR